MTPAFLTLLMMCITGKKADKNNGHFKGFSGLHVPSRYNLNYFMRVEHNNVSKLLPSVCSSVK